MASPPARSVARGEAWAAAADSYLNVLIPIGLAIRSDLLYRIFQLLEVDALAATHDCVMECATERPLTLGGSDGQIPRFVLPLAAYGARRICFSPICHCCVCTCYATKSAGCGTPRDALGLRSPRSIGSSRSGDAISQPYNCRPSGRKVTGTVSWFAGPIR